LDPRTKSEEDVKSSCLLHTHTHNTHTSPRDPGGNERTNRPNPNEKENLVVIVAGHLVIDPTERDDYLSGCVEVVRQARGAPGCLDFSLTADLLESGRINIFERWESQAAVEAFRGSGPSDEQGAAIVSAEVAEYDVTSERNLT
jgi:quinol monooxygenase YgiN